MFAIMLMKEANHTFKPLLSDLESDCVLGAAPYPATVKNALQVLAEYTNQLLNKSIMKSKKPFKTDQANNAASFYQMNKNRICKQSLCFKCKQKWQPGYKHNEKQSTSMTNVQIHEHQVSWAI